MPDRVGFRVLVVTTRSRKRLDHIQAVATEHARNPQRSLFYVVHLDDYLCQGDYAMLDNMG